MAGHFSLGDGVGGVKACLARNYGTIRRTGAIAAKRCACWRRGQLIRRLRSACSRWPRIMRSWLGVPRKGQRTLRPKRCRPFLMLTTFVTASPDYQLWSFGLGKWCLLRVLRLDDFSFSGRVQWKFFGMEYR